MTETELRNRVVREASTWLGVKEGSSRHKALIDLYNKIDPLPAGYKMTVNDPWCAAFVSAVGASCGLRETLLPECSCSRMIRLYQAAGRWVEDDAYVPAPGDVIFYGWTDSGTGDYTGAPDHVGIVQDCSDGMISVLEGNFKDAVGVRRIAVNARYIRGYALPDYAKAAGGSTPWPDVPAEAWYLSDVKWAARHGLVTGYPDGTFRPEEPMTRAEVCAVLRRLTEAKTAGIDLTV